MKDTQETEINLNQPVLDFKGNPIKVTKDSKDDVLRDFLFVAVGQGQSKTPDEIIHKARLVERLRNDMINFKAEEILILKKCFVQLFYDETTIQILRIIAPNELK